MEIQLLSDRYTVRFLSAEDIEAVYRLCIGNPLYYEYCPPIVTKDSIRKDMAALPPNTAPSSKYYIGFFDEGYLIAVMDLIEGYPRKEIAYIGFFMTDRSVQKKGIGTAIIRKVCEYLKTAGFHSIQLAWVKGNPQAEHFWTKNHFVKVKETLSSVGGTAILAELVY